MKAARLHKYRHPLVIESVSDPTISHGEGVIVRIAGSGFCHSDIYQVDGDFGDTCQLNLPFILGHENAGYVHKIGPDAVGLKEGDPVLVYGGWGCGVCEFCKSGDEQLCDARLWPGISPIYQGGYAEYMYVRSYKYLLKVVGDPTDLAPLTDAALTSYRAVKKVKDKLGIESFSVVFGIGGLGSFALQYLKQLYSSTIIAIDIVDRKLSLAEQLGADYTINSKTVNIEQEVRGITNGKGAKVILDFVGSDSTAGLISNMISKHGTYVVIGLAGGTAHMPLRDLIRTEGIIAGNEWGNYNELREVYRLYTAGTIKLLTRRRNLDEINEVIEDVRNAENLERPVLIPK